LQYAIPLAANRFNRTTPGTPPSAVIGPLETVTIVAQIASK